MRRLLCLPLAWIPGARSPRGARRGLPRSGRHRRRDGSDTSSHGLGQARRDDPHPGRRNRAQARPDRLMTTSPGLGMAGTPNGNGAGPRAAYGRHMRPGFLLVLAAVSAALLLPGTAVAGGGNYVLDGGTPAEQAEVHAALEASRFDWSVVPAV